MVNDKIVNGFMKLSIKEKLGYSLGDTASHFVWDLVGFWLLIFYTDIYGLSPALAGVIMFVGIPSVSLIRFCSIRYLSSDGVHHSGVWTQW